MGCGWGALLRGQPTSRARDLSACHARGTAGGLRGQPTSRGPEILRLATRETTAGALRATDRAGKKSVGSPREQGTLEGPHTLATIKMTPRPLRSSFLFGDSTWRPKPFLTGGPRAKGGRGVVRRLWRRGGQKELDARYVQQL